MNIKGSFADCSVCSLLNCESAIADTNCSDNIRNTQIFVVAENPGKDEVKGAVCENIPYPAGTPLIGKSGSIFRKVFNKYITSDDSIKYFITNTVLCCTIKPDGTTGNPEQDVIDRCKVNLFKMISMCDPKIIIAMGTTPMKALGIEGGITTNQGKFFKFKNPDGNKEFDVIIVTHPSYVARNGGLDTDVGRSFDYCFKLALDFIKNDGKKVETQTIVKRVTEPHLYSIPDKFYTDEYRLVDIQYINQKKQLVFIFRDRKNEKIYYIPARSVIGDYYWYESLDEKSRRLVEPVSNLILKLDQFDKRSTTNSCYESDRRIAEKHAVDYYLKTKGEAPIVKRNILFFDIEIYTFNELAFPSIEDALFPISMISFAIDDGPVHVWLLKLNEIDNRIDDVCKQFSNLKIFTNEVKMITEWINFIHTKEPDFLCGWNSNNFDWQYIYFRMKNLKLRTSSISKFDNVWCDGKSKVDITGLIALDLLWLYKTLTYTNEPSYSLENIAQKVLGHGKKQYSGNLNELYRKDIKTLIEYSYIDTKLLQELDNKKGHVSLQDELRKAATTTHLGASSTIGQADGLFNFELKKQGLIMKNAHHTTQTAEEANYNNEEEDEEHIIGAYVRQPIGGIYDWVIDFDYTSLYPSIICSFNIGPNTYVAKITQEESYLYAYKPEEFCKKFSQQIILNPIYNDKISKVSVEQFYEFINKNKYIVSPSGCIYKSHAEEKSYFYNIIKKLFSQRKTYKKMWTEFRKNGDTFNSKIYDNMQLSYKILMNSLYGVIAQKYFRFYNLDLASTVTISGQELIKFAGHHVDRWMHDQTKNSIDPDFEHGIEESKTFLRYCDTDSLFIWMKPFLESKQLDFTVDNIKKESSLIQDFLNKEILREYIKRRNIPIEESMFDLKNELICKRYYCLNVKKKYALNVINKEGVDVDEIEIKGLEVRRSDFSELTKSMLNDVIKMILKNQEVSIIDIENYISNVEHKARSLISSGDMSIYKTVAFSKPIEEYKTIPQSIRGMMFWNILEYDHFRVGMRGILVPIKSINMSIAPESFREKFNYVLMKKFDVKKDFNIIVIPEDISKIPDYYIIDIEKVLNFAIYDRVSLLLEPLQKKVESQQLKWDF